MKTIPVTATFTFEVEVEVSGTVDPPEPDVGINKPQVQGTEIISLSAIQRRFNHKLGKIDWNLTDLMFGINKSSADIQLLFANIEALFKDELNEALLKELEE